MILFVIQFDYKGRTQIDYKRVLLILNIGGCNGKRISRKLFYKKIY